MPLIGEPAASVLAELERFGRDNDAAQPDRARKMLNLERDTAELVFLLVRAAGRRRVLEVGTSNGYSAIWLALALDAGAAPLVSIERDPDKRREAAEALRRAGLEGRVNLLLGDATATVASLAGPFDCVFFDADRISAPAQLQLLLPKLAPDCLLLADNALSHPGEIAAYRAAVEALPGFACAVVPVGKGLHVAVRRGRRRGAMMARMADAGARAWPGTALQAGLAAAATALPRSKQSASSKGGVGGPNQRAISDAGLGWPKW